MVSEIGGEIVLPKNPPTATLVVHKKLDTSQNVELHFYHTRTKKEIFINFFVLTNSKLLTKAFL